MSNNRIADYWDRSSADWYKNADAYVEQIVQNPAVAFPPAVYAWLQKCFPDFRGVAVCVPSSGDNTAAFAFHLLGARVCSADISQNQIDNAKRIAGERNWDIEFVCNDSMALGKLGDKSFDLVYTSNGVHVWIPDLAAMYGSFHRILKDGGHYVFFETHPMTRPFDASGPQIKIVKPYEDTGPFDFGVPEYAWRTQDFINALIAAGFELAAMEEFHSTADDFIKYDYFYNSEEARAKDGGSLYDWRRNPWAALPQCLALWSRKK